MKILCTILLATLLTACSTPSLNDTTTNSAVNNDTTVRSITADTTDAKTGTPPASTIGISVNSGTKQDIPRLYEEIKTPNDLPSWLEIKIKGQIKFGAKWVDKSGENVMIITSTEAHVPVDVTPGDGDNDTKGMEFYAVQYVKKDKKAVLVWSINDLIKTCQFDMDLFYVPYSFSLTDLNGDGVRETLFLYQLMCRSDVSEDNMKLIMHDGKTKYAIRGTTKVNTGNNEYVGGKMEVDALFEKAPKGFKEYAVDMWNRFVDTEKRAG